MFSSRLGSRGALTESLFQSRGLRHHPDFRNTEGWKAVHKEQTIPYKHYPEDVQISALYTPCNFEMGVDLREQMTLCDAGDVFTIPANIEKTFDQISNAVGYIASTGSMPVIMGGDHSIGFPTVRGIASLTTKKIGIIHFDRHADISEKDLDERMHSTLTEGQIATLTISPTGC